VRADARFCDGCGARLAPDEGLAEYKQVTVLFADVVRSMDLAAGVGAERLRAIMAELFDRCSAVVRRFGGTVHKFTGDGVMAVFGAPVALETTLFGRAWRSWSFSRGCEYLAPKLSVGTVSHCNFGWA
jgi:adenylate cyclase